MQAHRDGLPCPPQANIDRFVRYAEDLGQLYGAECILLTCSTMNRAAGAVARRALVGHHAVPVVQIDGGHDGGSGLAGRPHTAWWPPTRPRFALARAAGGNAARLGTRISIAEAVVEPRSNAWPGRPSAEHNEIIARATTGSGRAPALR